MKDKQSIGDYYAVLSFKAKHGSQEPVYLSLRKISDLNQNLKTFKSDQKNHYNLICSEHKSLDQHLVFVGLTNYGKQLSNTDVLHVQNDVLKHSGTLE